MACKGCRFNVADNSGAIIVEGFSNIKYKVGNIIKCAVKKAIPNSNVKKGSVVRGLIVRMKNPILSRDGSIYCSGENAVILLSNSDAPLGTRVFGIIFRSAFEGKSTNFKKILSLAEVVY